MDAVAKDAKKLRFEELRDVAEMTMKEAFALRERVDRMASALFGVQSLEADTRPEPNHDGAYHGLADALEGIGRSVTDCNSALDRF